MSILNMNLKIILEKKISFSIEVSKYNMNI